MNLHTLKILAIDDNPDHLIRLKTLISKTFPKASLIFANSGIKGITLAIAEKPDVILLSIGIPGPDGIEVCRKLKAEASVSLVPVLYITDRNTNPEVRMSALVAGAEGFISTPMDDAELAAQVRAMAKIREGNIRKQQEEEIISRIVSERTGELEQELLRRREMELLLNQTNEELRKSRSATLNLLEDLKQEIEARKKSEEALKEQERSLANMVSNLPGFVYRCANDRDWTMEYISEGCLEITGYSPEEFVGNKTIAFNDIILREYVDILWEKWQNLLLRRAVFEDEYPILRKDGEIRWLWERGNGIFSEEGQLICLEGFITDITDHRRSETIQKIQYNIADAVVTAQNLQELYVIVRSELAALMDTTNFFVAFFDEVNGMLSAPFEKDEKDIVPEWKAEKSLTGLVIREKRPLLLHKEDIRKLAEAGEIEFIGSRAEIWLGVPLQIGENVTGAIVVQSYNDPKAFDGSSLELLELVANQLCTYIERKKAEETAVRLTKGIEQSPVSIVITDIAGNIEYVNPKFTEVTGYTAQEALGKNPRVLKSGEHPQEFYKSLWDNILSGKDWRGEFHNLRKNGTLYWENAIISPIINESGNITHFIAIKEDITGKKKMEQDLITAKEKAEESDRLKSSFLANMSHELRTPMTGILGFSEVLCDLSRDEDQARMARLIFESGQRLMDTLNLILDLSKLEAELEEIPQTSFDLIGMLRTIIVSYQPAAAKKQLSVGLETPEETMIIHSNERMVNSIFHNLLNNAIKFTDEGGIKLAVSREAAGPLSFAVCKVIDTGIGIPEKYHGMIFAEFRQVSEGYSREFEGTGLGLSITKKFVEKLGGSIYVESQPGEGTTFVVRLPLNAVHVKFPPEEIREDKVRDLPWIPDDVVSRKRILLVEDEVANQELVLAFIKGKFQAEVAGNGLEALKLCGSILYDAIMMDINLGTGMDGTETAQKLRQDVRYHRTPIIAMTAFAMKGDKERYLSLGFDDYISKPFRKKELLETLGRLFDLSGVSS